MPRRVIVIDDDADLLNLFAAILADDGYEAVLCRDGATALSLMREDAPDAAVLDIRLDTPERGWQIIAVMKADPALAAIPVIVATADLAVLLQYAAGLHATGCTILPKPFDLDQFSSLVREHAGPPDAE